MKKKYPYKKAKLIHHDRDLSKRWYVSCWVWSLEKNELVRRRFYSGINRLRTITERWEAGKELESYVNDLLDKGYVVGKDVSNVNADGLNKLTIGHSFDFVMSLKKNSVSAGSLLQYNSTVNKLKNWLKNHHFEKTKITGLSKDMVIAFMDYLLNSDKINSNQTYNNHLSVLRIFLNALLNRDNKLFGKNFAEDIKMLPTSSRKHAAYSTDEMKSIKAEMVNQKQLQLLLFIQFIYYTLARPNEIYHLKVGNIDLDQKRIFISRSISKNRKSSFVDLYPPLESEIVKSGIMKYPKEYFIFSPIGHPALKICHKKWFYLRHVAILQSLDMNKSDREYTLYSYKHSGAINLFLSGLEPIDIQKQCRHHSLQQTMDYLRELDLFRKTDHFNKVRGF